MRLRSKLVAAAACVMAVILPLGACSGSQSASRDDGKMIISYYASEPQNPLIPGDTNETGGGHVITMLYAGLVGYDKDGNPVNEVAKSITPHKDNTVFDIVLNDDWTFTDGTPVTAQSFTKAWSYTANATNAQMEASFFAPIKGYDKLQSGNEPSDEQLEGLKVVSDYEFTVTLTAPSSTFPVMLGGNAFYPLPESFYADPDAYGSNPVGNGPYKFVSWAHNQDILVERNDSYHGAFPAKNDGIDFVIYTDIDTAYSDVQAGNLDLLDAIPSSSAVTFQYDPTVQAVNNPGSVIQTFTFPSDMPHFGNDEEGHLRRQAVSMAINRDTLCKKILGGTATPATDFLSPVTPGYSTSLQGADVLSYNPDKARELWDEANAINPWNNDTDVLKFSYNADNNAAKSLYEAVAHFISNNLGINATTNPIATFSEFRKEVTDRQLKTPFRTGWQPDYPAADNYLVQLYDSAAADGNGSNDGDYKNPDFDALMDKAAQASSVDEANKYYQQGEELLLKDLPAVPLYYANAAMVSATGVNNVETNWMNMPVLQDVTKDVTKE